MDTMTTDKKRIRRNHSPALKAQILAECMAPGASVAKVAMAYGINANIVHGWRKLACDQRPAPVAAPVATPSFVPVPIHSLAPTGDRIHVELRRGALTLSVAWPTSAAPAMAGWMRELLR